MISRAVEWYSLLQADLLRVSNSSFPSSVRVEICFRITDHYLGKVLIEAVQHSFGNVEEEILFFKEKLPMFIAEKEYYRLLNYAHTFCPSNAGSNERTRFWLQEIKRVEHFRNKHPVFCAYHSSEQIAMDHTYFNREQVNGFSELKGWFLARERYALYAQKQLNAST